MNGRPILCTLARLLDEHGLEAILIGNAAAALQGAPLTTIDLDFLFRKTRGNLAKLRAVAKSLGAMTMRPVYPASDRLRLMRDDDLLQVNFTPGTAPPRVRRVEIDGHPILVEDFGGVIDTARPLPDVRGTESTEGLKLASAEELQDQIRRLLALPPDQRTHFLRKRVGIQASCL